MSLDEDIARRFEKRNGFELIDYAPVALPLFRLTIDAVTMVHHEIPPIKEFVMRSLRSGLTHRGEIAGFLGLDPPVVSATVDQLLGDHYATDPDDGTVTLTQRGQDVLLKARESSPRDEMQVFLYDRLLRKPVRLTPDQVLAPAFVDPQRVIEIRPYPADGPEVEDLSMPDVSLILEQQAGGRSAFGRDLLRIKRIVRRVRLFRPAVALVFKKVRSSDIHVDFIVDESRNEPLSNVFAERGGPRKMGFVRSIDQSHASAELRRYLGPTVQKLLPDQSTLDQRRLAVSTARIKHQVAVARLDRSLGDDADKVLLIDSITTAQDNLAAAEGELRAFPARPVAPFEIPELLDRALEEATQLLMISSNTLNKSVADAWFVKRLEAMLERGVRAVISVTEGAPPGALAIDVEKLRARFPHLRLLSEGRGKWYHLVCDSTFALITNRPFLSNLEKVRTFHHVVGYLLQRPDLVEAFVERVTPVQSAPRLAVRRSPPGRRQ